MSTPVRDDTIELREILGAIRRGRRWIAVGIAFGLTVALLVNWLGPTRYEATASVIVRDRSSGGGGSLPATGALEGVADLFSLPGELASSVDTETAILESRWLLEETIRESGLQVKVERPRGAGVDSLFAAVEVDPGIEEAEYTFRREGTSFRVVGPEGFQATLDPDEVLEVPGARLRLRREVPERFRIRLVDLQDAVDEIRLWRRLDIGDGTGDLVEVSYHGQGPRTAERAANNLVRLYLRDRQERTDSLHEERIGVLSTVVDSVGRELSEATERLRRFQQQAEVYNPERLGEVERAVELRAEADALQVEARALERILSLARADSLTITDLLAIPSFLENDVVSSLLDRLLALQQQRQELLQRRTEQDPDVLVLEENIENLTRELTALARSYRANVQQQLIQLREELAEYRSQLADRPEIVADSIVLSQELERIASSYVGVQAQAVQARLDRIGDGADLRQVDVAVAPKEASFPRPLLNLAIGGVGGLLFGLVGALTGGFLSTRVDDPRRVREWTGVPAYRLDSGPRLLPGAFGESRSILVVGVAGASPVEPARRLAESGALRDGRVALVDLTPSSRMLPAGDAAKEEGSERVPVEGGEAYEMRHPAVMENGGGMSGLRRGLDEMEAAYSLVVVALASPESPEAVSIYRKDRPVLLAVRDGASALDELADLVASLEQGGTPVTGVVVVPNGTGTGGG